MANTTTAPKRLGKILTKLVQTSLQETRSAVCHEERSFKSFSPPFPNISFCSIFHEESSYATKKESPSWWEGLYPCALEANKPGAVSKRQSIEALKPRDSGRHLITS